MTIYDFKTNADYSEMMGNNRVHVSLSWATEQNTTIFTKLLTTQLRVSYVHFHTANNAVPQNRAHTFAIEINA